MVSKAPPLNPMTFTTFRGALKLGGKCNPNIHAMPITMPEQI